MNTEKLNDEVLDEISGGSIIPYQIQPGDTLGAVAKKFNVSLDQLMRWNNIKDPNLVTVGQQLKIKF